MLYVPFPSLTETERLARLRPMAWEAVAVSPDEALAQLGETRMPRSLDLEMRGDEPVYRMSSCDGRRITLSARTGAPAGPVDAEAARRLTGAGPGASVEEVARDQWTVTARYDPLRPFHKVALNDAAGTELYVSQGTGEIVLDTTRFERGWNWVGAVTHWVYLTPLRARAESVARRGALDLRHRRLHGAHRPRPRDLAPAPEPALHARTRHALSRDGALAPFRRAYRRDRAHHLHPQRLALDEPEPLVHLPRADRRPARGLCRGGQPCRPHDREPTRVGRRCAPRPASRADRRTLGHDGARPHRQTGDRRRTLNRPDRGGGGSRDGGCAGWRASIAWNPTTSTGRRSRAGRSPSCACALPIPSATWLHVDPRSGEILNRLDRSGRVNRWLFTALHRLDLPVLVGHPPARDAAQWLLNLLAGALVITGLVIGCRRIGPKASAPSPLPARGERAASPPRWGARRGGSRG